MGAVHCKASKNKSKSESNSNISAKSSSFSSQDQKVPLQVQPLLVSQSILAVNMEARYTNLVEVDSIDIIVVIEVVVMEQPAQMQNNPYQQVPPQNQVPYLQHSYGQQNPNIINPPYLQNNQEFGNQNYLQYIQYQQNNPLVNPRQKVDVDLSQASDFIIEQLRNSILSKQLQLSQNIIVSINGRTGTIEGPMSELQQATTDINAQLQYLMQQYVKQDLVLNRKEVEIFGLMTQAKQQIETNEVCKITINQSNQYNQSNVSNLSNQQNDNILEQVALRLTSQNKTFKIHQGDIQKLKSEAIVSSCNQQLEFHQQAGVAKKICQLGGIRYEQTCKQYIQSNQKLQYGSVVYHHHNAVNIQHILTVATPFYQQGSQTDQHLQIIAQNIHAVFQMANQKQIKEITFPIFGGGTSGFQFDSAAQCVITAILEALYQTNTTVITVNIVEIDAQKIIRLTDITNSLIKQAPKRQIKYQWQWFDTVFKDYDDKEINEQIDIGYESFLLDNTKNEIRLIFPHSKVPGTHKVDLAAMTLTDNNLSLVQKIKLGTHQGRATYYFDNQPIHNGLSEFIFLQNQQGLKQFEIFYKQHKIVFSKSKIQQINEVTGYAREVKHVAYQQQQPQVQNIMRGNQYQIQQFQLNQQKQPQELPKQQKQKQQKQPQSRNYVTLEAININRFNQISKIIKNLIRSQSKEINILIPIISANDMATLKQIIEEESLETKGSISQNTSMSVWVTALGEKRLVDHIKQSSDRQQVIIDQQLSAVQQVSYPQTWTPQSQNSIKVDLPQTDKEFQRVNQLFLATNPTKKIYKIYRIQNKNLWDNYMFDKQKVLKLHKEANNKLTPVEQERYLWHGVSGQHPQIIYQSDKEGFNPAYSKCGMWGNGVYFAEKAIYSQNYSYQLTANDDPNYAGKLVFLCCLITTGKVHTCNSDNSLKVPPIGFDCVSGFTDNSNVFILYTMDVRRAYPAYEVIYG